MATEFARALTRENSVPGQLTRKGMSSLSWGSARPPPDASRRPQSIPVTAARLGPDYARRRLLPPSSAAELSSRRHNPLGPQWRGEG